MKDYLFNDFAYYKDSLWFFSGRYSFIEKYDISTNTTHIVNIGNRITVVDSIIRIGDILYVLDMSGRTLVIYDISNNSLSEFKMDCDYYYKENYCAFFIRNSELVIIPKYGNRIIFFDIAKMKFRNLSLNLCEDCIECGIENGEDFVLFGKQNIYILSFSILNDISTKVINLNESIGRIVDSTMDENTIYILNDNGEIFEVDVTQWITNFICQCSFEVYGAEKIEKTNGRIWVLPCKKTQGIYSYSLCDKNWGKYSDYPQDFEYQAYDNWSVFWKRREVGKEIWYAMRSANYILIIDKHVDDIFWKKIQSVDLSKIYHALIEREGKGFINEDDCNNLDTYVELLCGNSSI